MNNQNTLKFYNENSESFFNQTLNVDMQSLYEPFIANIDSTNPSQQQILDLGCGSGRDSVYFANLGFNVTAIDGSDALIDLAKKNHHQSNVDWNCSTFKDITKNNWQKKFAGIWACASLLHNAYVELPFLIDNLIGMLAADGIFYASFKYGNSGQFKDDRFFCNMNEQRWKVIKDELVCSFDDTLWITEDQRSHTNQKWFNVIMKR